MHALRFDDVVGVANARGVNERCAQPIEVNRLCDEIARGTGNVGNDCASRADERIEQAGFADVGLAENRNLKSVAHQPSASRIGKQRGRAR